MATYSFQWVGVGGFTSGTDSVEADSDEAAYRRMKEFLGEGSLRKQLVSGSIVMTDRREISDPSWAKNDLGGKIAAAGRRIWT